MSRRFAPGRGPLARLAGFTMIEMVVALVVVGVLAAIAIANVGPAMDTVNATSESNKLRMALRYAQSLGFAQTELGTNDRVVWGLQVTGSSYSLTRGGAAQTDVNLPNESSATYTAPAGVTFSAGTVNYDFRGIPCDAAGTALGSDVTMTTTYDGKSDTITVTQGTGYLQ